MRLADKTEEFRCPACGWLIGYSAASEEAVCPFCQAESNVPEGREETGLSLTEYACSCGAVFGCASEEAKFPCPFCGGAAGVTGARRPLPGSGILPFRIDAEAARDLFSELLGGTVPRRFRSPLSAGRLCAAYLPADFFDIEAETVLNLRTKTWERAELPSRGKYLPVLRKYAVLRSVTGRFRQLPVFRPAPFDRVWAESLEPVFSGEARKPQPEDFPSVPAVLDGSGACAADAAKRVAEAQQKQIVSDLSRENGVISTEVLTRKIRLSLSPAGSVLLPVWILRGEYRKQAVYLVINGQTGTAATPVLPQGNPLRRRCLRVFLAVTGGIAVLCLLLFLLGL